MKFRSIINSIHAMSAAVRGSFLSNDSKYKRKSGKKATTVYLSVESVDTLSQQMIITLGENALSARYRVFTAVLKGQKIDFVKCPPCAGDKIEIKIGAVTEQWWVANAGSSRCWGYLDGNQAIWIFASASEP